MRLMPTESLMMEAELRRRIEDVNRREEALAARAADLDDGGRRCAEQEGTPAAPPVNQMEEAVEKTRDAVLSCEVADAATVDHDLAAARDFLERPGTDNEAKALVTMSTVARNYTPPTRPR